MPEEKQHAELQVEIPEDIELRVDGHTISVKGEKGSLERTFKEDFIDYRLKDGQLNLVAHTKRLPHRKQVAIMKAIE